MFHYYDPWKHQKTEEKNRKTENVFRGYRSGTLVENGLIVVYMQFRPVAYFTNSHTYLFIFYRMKRCFVILF